MAHKQEAAKTGIRKLAWGLGTILFGSLGIPYLLPKSVNEWVSNNSPWSGVGGVLRWLGTPASGLWIGSATTVILAVLLYPRPGRIRVDTFPEERQPGRWRVRARDRWREQTTGVEGMSRPRYWYSVGLPLIIGVVAGILWRIIVGAGRVDEPVTADPAIWLMLSGVLAAFLIGAIEVCVRAISRRLHHDAELWATLMATGRYGPWTAFCIETAEHSCSSGWIGERQLERARLRPLWIRLFSADLRGFKKKARRVPAPSAGPDRQVGHCPNVRRI